MSNGGGVMSNQGEAMSKTRWEPPRERGRRGERARRSRRLEPSTTAAVTALGAMLAAALLAACLPKMHRVPDTERCAMGVVSACTPDICATYAPDEVPAGCLDPDAGGTETPDGGSTDTSSAPDTATDTGTDTAADTGTDTMTDTLTDTGPDTIADTGTDTMTDTATDTTADTVPETVPDTGTDTMTDTMTDTGPCDPPTEGCPCSYQGKPDGVCAEALFNGNMVCQEPTGFEVAEVSCDGLDNDCDGITDEGCPCDYQGDPDGVCLAGGAVDGTDGSCSVPSSYEATEASCDGLDNDCDGVADEGCACDYQGNSDGVCATAVLDASGVCQYPTGFQATETTCDGLDNDCDGVTDEGCPCHFQNLDQGVCTTSLFAADGVCAAPAGYEANETTCDGLDNDCDGVMDEGCAQGAFVQVPAGTFTMGSPDGELGHHNDEVQHEVTLTHSFYLQETEVTQSQWEALMGNNPSDFTYYGDDCPVERVNWWDALGYANAVSAAQGLPACYALEGCQGTPGTGMVCTSVTVNAPDGNPYLCTGYRLPTEAEWEYAYRAGTTTAFYNGDITDLNADPNLDVIGWYKANSSNRTLPVAQKEANAWGLYDMAGNVWEWVWDWYGDYPAGGVTDPTGPETGSAGVDRGGSWLYGAGAARAAERGADDHEDRMNDLGFRLARTAP